LAFDTKIPDSELYAAEMRKSLTDKSYFADKVEAQLFVDYGCADGVMLKYLKANFPSCVYLGYDVSKEMIHKANTVPMGITFTDNWREVVDAVESFKNVSPTNKVCLIASSIIHEEYAYGSQDDIEEFWGRVWNTGFDYVAIRDMMVSRTTSRPADPLTVARIRQLYDKGRLAEWEGNWGSINENWSLVHFLLTYRYTNNWVRELKENYLPISLEDFLPTIPAKYVPHYMEHYTLPFIRNKAREDFGIELQDRTHLKLILRKGL
jgi:hypothetical protein